MGEKAKKWRRGAVNFDAQACLAVTDLRPTFGHTEAVTGRHQEGHWRAMVYLRSGQGEFFTAAAIGGGEDKLILVESIGQKREMPQPKHTLAPILPIKDKIEF